MCKVKRDVAVIAFDGQVEGCHKALFSVLETLPVAV